MNISLTPELEQVIEDRVKSGMYHSASEVVREALRLLIEHDQLQQLKHDELKRQIQIGIAAADRGEVVSEQQAMARLDVIRGKVRAKKGARK